MRSGLQLFSIFKSDQRIPVWRWGGCAWGCPAVEGWSGRWRRWRNGCWSWCPSATPSGGSWIDTYWQGSWQFLTPEQTYSWKGRLLSDFISDDHSLTFHSTSEDHWGWIHKWNWTRDIHIHQFPFNQHFLALLRNVSLMIGFFRGCKQAVAGGCLASCVSRPSSKGAKIKSNLE